MIKPLRPAGPTAKDWVNEFSNRNSSWQQTVSEWIDNSVGHNAQRIEVVWSPNRIEIRDNGVGCTRKMFAALISPNAHVEDPDVVNPVSRYGIGAKYGFCWCQGPTHCCSRRGNECYSIRVDWQNVQDWDDFDIATEDDRAVTICEQLGVFGNGVLIRQDHNRKMNRLVFAAVYKALCQRYWAAVETGVEIDVRFRPPGRKSKPLGGLLTGKQMPIFADGHRITELIYLADGRSIEIDGGVLDNSVRLSDPGFEYIYGHRVVLSACGLGAGQMDFERVYFRVFLRGDKTDWRVTTTKDQLHDSDIAALEQAVFDHCKPLLEEAAKGDYARLLEQELLNEVGEALTAANKRRATRGEGTTSGTKTPTGEGSPHTKTSKPREEEGNRSTPKSRQPISIKLTEFDDESAHLIGKALVRDRIVRINRRHPCIGNCLDRQDKHTIQTIAVAIWSEAWIKTDDKGQRLTEPRIDFVAKISAMFAEERIINEMAADKP